MNTKYVLLVSLFFTAICFSQPEIEWQKSYGGSELDWARSIEQTQDGGYIVAGYIISNDGDITNHYGGIDYWVLKLSSSGEVEWQKTLGGSNNDIAWTIKQTFDGGFIVAGESDSTDGDIINNLGNSDYWVVKLSSLGEIEWQKSLGGSYSDTARELQLTDDGGFVVSGSSSSTDGDITENYGISDYWVVKLSSSGEIEWQKSLGGSNSDLSYSIKQALDGGFIVAGNSFSNDGDVSDNHGVSDMWVVKLSSLGEIEWEKSLGGSGDDYAYSICVSSDGGFLVGGESNSSDGDVSGNHGDFDYWVVKLSSLGEIEWQKSYGGSAIDSNYSIIQTYDEGYILIGRSASIDGDSTSNNGSMDSWIVKINSIGTIEWQKSYGGSEYESPKSIQQLPNGSFILAGISESNDGDVTENNGEGDFWVVKLSPALGVNDFDTISANLYPNPTNGLVTIEVANLSEINIYDSLGKLSFSQKFENVNNYIFNVSHLAKGIYSMIIFTSEGKETKKLILK